MGKRKKSTFALIVMASLCLLSCGGGGSFVTPPPPPPPTSKWTWLNGANVVNQHGTYGIQGTAAPGNVPGAGVAAAHSTDASGNFWLFGGDRYDSTGAIGNINDLWNYSAGQWTWMSGSNVVNQPAVYGIQGTAAPGNVPSARSFASSWTDASGNFWLFGGSLDPLGVGLFLNDLWKYSAGQWTWMGGSNLPNQPGTYGTLGTAAPGNVPGVRGNAVTWTDSSGDVWLFGGKGMDSTGTAYGFLNDLWKYSAGQWTWMGGSNLINQPGIYGTQGTASPSNVPGARFYAASWADASGNLWLFGGDGYDSTGNIGVLNDLWKYSAGQWTWMGGSTLVSQKGTYGTLGTAAAGNIPGARYAAFSWTDVAGNFWLFGGSGYDSTGTNLNNLNDLWKYSAGQWTWVAGSNVANQSGVYGTQGTAASSNVPGARYYGASWSDKSGNLFLFGGYGNDSAGTTGALNDLWKYGQ